MFRLPSKLSVLELLIQVTKFSESVFNRWTLTLPRRRSYTPNCLRFSDSHRQVNGAQPGGIRHRDEGGDDHASCLTGLVGIGVKKLLCLQSLFVQPLLADIGGCIFTSVVPPPSLRSGQCRRIPCNVQVLLHAGKDLGREFCPPWPGLPLHCPGDSSEDIPMESFIFSA